MTLRLVVPDKPGEAERAAVLAPLLAYNVAQGGDPRLRPVAIVLTDADGQTHGGLWGKCIYDWLFVELLAVADAHRGGGHGTALIERAEAIARAHGCIGLWLDTFSFQARGFYEKLGFTVFGTLDDHPMGGRRFFLAKRF